MKSILISCVAFALSAQEQPVVKTTTGEVVLDLVVRDKKGKPIRDLTLNDVVVLDNGQRQTITSFRFIEGREAIEQGSKINLDPLRQLRLVTLVFERLAPEARRIARDAAIDLVKSEQAQNVFYSVFGIDSKLYGLQQFTSDKALLQKAIDRATSGQYSTYASESERLKESLSKSDQTLSQLGPASSNPATGAMGTQAVEQKLAQIMSDMMRFDQATSQTQASRVSIFALLGLVRGQTSMPGRKTVIYFSQGMYVPPQLDEPFRTVLSAANRSNVTFYAVDTRGVLTASQNASAAAQLQYAARRTAADIVRTDGAVSKEDILAADTAETAGRNNVQLALRDLSDSTGGFMIGDSNDLRVPLRRVNEQINSYYEVSYNPGIHTYDGTFRKTSVEVSRKDVVVQARYGYFALPPDSAGQPLLPYEVPLLKALDAKPLSRDLEFRSTVVRFEPTASATAEVLMVEVPLAGVHFTEQSALQSYTARISVIALIKDSNGEVMKKFSHDLPLAGPLAQLSQLKGGNFLYKEQLLLAPGRYTVETAVIDHESGKLGARRAVLIVPEKRSGVAMSNLCVVRNYQPTSGIDPAEPFQFNGGRITPALAATVYNVKGAQLSMFFVVYPDPAISDKPSLEMEYLLDGKVVGRGAVALPPPDATGKIPYVMSSSSEGMPAGNYEVRAVVRQGNSVSEERAFVTMADRP